jgi:hypothetical protein
MSSLRQPCLSTLVALGLLGSASAGGRQPGSLLVYPVHRSGPEYFTIIAVTNTNTQKASPWSLGGTTDVHFEYANVIAGQSPFAPQGCNVVDRVETLSPADTLSVLTRCHNATTGQGQEGYAVLSALDPLDTLTTWGHDFLVGSAIVVNAAGASYSVDAIPFRWIGLGGDPRDGVLQLDDLEYEAASAAMIVDSFATFAGSQLALINLTGSDRERNKVKITAYNDNEFLLSDTLEFNCWFDQPLTSVSAIFRETYLKSTPNDPYELDISCSGLGRIETGWATIDSIAVKTPGGTTIDSDGVILGSITAGPYSMFDGGRLLWEDPERQTNGALFTP